MALFQNFDLPPTYKTPDHSYFDGKVESYDFVSQGHLATLGFIQGGFDGTFPADEGGEEITLLSPLEGRGYLSIDVINDNGEIEERHRLVDEGDIALVPGGKQMRIKTAQAVAEYVCVYPGKPAGEGADVSSPTKTPVINEEEFVRSMRRALGGGDGGFRTKSNGVRNGDRSRGGKKKH